MADALQARLALTEWIQRMPAPPAQSSDGLGWRQIYAVRFRQPERCAISLPAVRGHFIAAHMATPTQLSLRIGGRWTRSRSAPGDVMMMAPNQESTWEWRGGLDEFDIFLDQSVIDTVAEEVTDRQVRFVDGIGLGNPDIFQIARELSQEIACPRAGTALFADLAAQRLALALIRGHSSVRDIGYDPRISIARHRLRRVLDYVEQHLAEEISIECLSAVASMSAGHFTRGFKKVMGESPYRYVMRRRVEQTKKLLAGTRLPIAEIAQACGFSSQSHLTAVFGQHCGMTPHRFRLSAD